MTGVPSKVSSLLYRQWSSLDSLMKWFFISSLTELRPQEKMSESAADKGDYYTFNWDQFDVMYNYKPKDSSKK